jgi:hypothetical protein
MFYVFTIYVLSQKIDYKYVIYKQLDPHFQQDDINSTTIH